MSSDESFEEQPKGKNKKNKNLSDSESDYEPGKKKAAAKKPAAKKAPAEKAKPAAKKKRAADPDTSDSGPDSDAEPGVKKKQKTSDTNGADAVFEGNKLYEFGKMKYVGVSEFKGKRYVNIREYYLDKNSGDMRPGKKGIMMPTDQWSKFKGLIDKVDADL